MKTLTTVIIVVFAITFLCLNSCRDRESFGSGPEIFEPNSMLGEPIFLNPEKLEPVYLIKSTTVI